MKTLVVTAHPAAFEHDLPADIEVVSCRDYLANPRFAHLGRFRVLNLSDAFSYQNEGYYVSLLAAVRLHRPEPDVQTIMDFLSRRITLNLAYEAEGRINHCLLHHAPAAGRDGSFSLDVFFGRCLEPAYARLAALLYEKFRIPAFTATLRRGKSGWELWNVEALHPSRLHGAAALFFRHALRAHLDERPRAAADENAVFSLAILVDPNEKTPPSNARALARMADAARAEGLSCEFITRRDFDRLREFDALFIRATTNVNDFTYQFSRCARNFGLAVIDDPTSILRCTNKVFLAEQAELHGIPVPKTVVVTRDNLARVPHEIPFPIVIKQPDSQFSEGVFKAENAAELEREARPLLEKSALLIAQEFVPTAFDWRIGILNRRPLYACKYFMARHHWQIVDNKTDREGGFKTIPIGDAPERVVKVALKMADLVGDGLYGVDLKETKDGRVVVIELNDNPSIDAGIEDAEEGEKLYRAIMREFFERIIRIKKLREIGDRRK